MTRQAGGVVLRVASYFAPNPGRKIDRLVLARKLDFGDDEASIVAAVDVDLPAPSRMRRQKSRLAKLAALPELNQRFSVRQRQRKLELVPGKTGLCALYGKEAAHVIFHPHTHHGAPGLGKISLPKPSSLIRPPAPSVARDEKLAFDFLWHDGISSLSRCHIQAAGVFFG